MTGMDPRFTQLVDDFVRENWVITSQSEFSVSLVKKASSRTLAIILGVIAIFVLFFDILIGLLCVIAVPLLVVLNNLTKKSGTMNISLLQDGSIRVSSNMKKYNKEYPPQEYAKPKHGHT